MDQPLSALYRRYRTVSLAVVTAAVMILSFLWYLPGAYHAGDMGEFHTYAFREFRFNNVIAMYVNHNLQDYTGPRFVVGGTGIEYPPLLSMLIRGTAGLGVARDVSPQSYRTGTPSPDPKDKQPAKNVVAYTWLNYAVDFLFGLLAIVLIALWRGARPWIFAASPLLFLFAGYNWDLIPIAMSIAGVLVLKWSVDKPDPGRLYNVKLEVLGFALLTLGVWFKLFPVVFIGAVLVQRIRDRQWRAAGLGVGVFALLSLLINVPVALANFDSWRFFLWIHQNRPAELSLWYWVVGGMDPGLMVRPDVTAAVTALSLLLVAVGGIAITIIAWRSPRRNIIMPMGCLLLVWWLTFNKVYDPNFDLWLLFVLAIMGAPLWLNLSTVLTSLLWYLLTFVGLYLSIQPNMVEINNWFIAHPLVGMLVIRLALLAVMILWLGRRLLTPDAGDYAHEEQPSLAEGDGARFELAPASQQ